MTPELLAQLGIAAGGAAASGLRVDGTVAALVAGALALAWIARSLRRLFARRAPPRAT